MLSRALRLLDERRADGRPLRVGLIGAGTFGTMTLSQLNRLAGVEIAGVADLDPSRVKAALSSAGCWRRPTRSRRERCPSGSRTASACCDQSRRARSSPSRTWTHFRIRWRSVSGTARNRGAFTYREVPGT